jgi:hypothetical protein
VLDASELLQRLAWLTYNNFQKRGAAVKKQSSQIKSKKVSEIEPYGKQHVDFSKFKADLSALEINKLLGPAGRIVVFPFFPIETLKPTKTIGLGRTNLTIIAPTIVQIDAATPFAGFDKNAQHRNPTIQMHFQPSGYGITSVATYVMTFTIQAFGQSTFNLAGNAGSGTIQNAGTKILNGLVGVSIIMQNVPPTQETFAFLEQTAGGTWNWLSTSVRFPDIVISQIGAISG